MHGEAPDVIRLSIHLPNQYLVTFFEDESLKYIVHRSINQQTMLTAWFQVNRNPSLADFAKEYTYAQFSRMFVFDKWSKKSKLYKCLDAIDPQLFKHLRTVNRVEYPTFKDAYQDHCLAEAANLKTRQQLHLLFATILQTWNLNLQLTDEDIENHCLMLLNNILIQQEKTLKDFLNMPVSTEVNDI
ncbi:9556_t:CDS:2, partial [Racocetra persica]